MSGTEETIRVERDDAIARVVMDRAERHNAMDETMATTLAETLEAEAADDDVRCIVLTGTGAVFNTGADLSTFEGDPSDSERLEGIATPLHDAVSTLVSAPKPVITGINGVVAGGGLGLSLAGDVVLAAEDARFEYAYPKIGLSGDGGATWLLPRLVGRRTAQRIAFLDEPIDAEAAVEMGLATESVSADSFDERLERLAADLASGPTKAYAEIKELFATSSTRRLDEHLEEEQSRIVSLADTDDYAAGLRGFLEKEPPTFHGE
ncbi:enoyl-CoA hydratase/isomerase family protein [Natronosalvus vescus]|uniref:enoyl-CoA hydratase/isomerase family protein n=1 Tax=Natronosalvus vescus TaxID=2953881 RepID=UPI0020906E36|nr:enoyl-CoA hydratase-related protein [Natronosalvus vescus]